ncbi:hypothetical protein BH10ACT1_BH10ACT1_00400 [soil metagenome]
MGAYLVDGLIIALVTGALAAYFFFHVLVGSPIGTVECRSSARTVETGSPSGPRFCFEGGDRVRYVPVADEAGLNTRIYLSSLVVTLLYQVVLQGVTGATLGKVLFGLRVVRPDGTNAGLLRCFGRTLLLPIDGLCCGILGIVVASRSRGHRRIGDMVATTLVIRKRDQLALLVARSGVALPDRSELAAAAWVPPSAPDVAAWSAAPAPQAAPMPGADAPTWDDARQAYIQFDRQLDAWMQWSDEQGAWRPIDR